MDSLGFLFSSWGGGHRSSKEKTFVYVALNPVHSIFGNGKLENGY